MPKTKRLICIEKIVTENKISSQEKILNMLKYEGFELTQATLSRDLKFLKVAKIPDVEYGYLYTIPGHMKTEPSERLMQGNIILNAFRSLEFSGNIAVLKTASGYANSVAMEIDKVKFRELVGTVAGDDTIIMVMREGIGKHDLINAIKLRIPGLSKKL